MIELRLLRYFVAVAETEHIGRAAKVLHVSQSPLSRQIRQLEEATALTLFERDRQRLRITTAGQWLLGRARLVLSHVEALERDAARLSKGEAGTLRIGFVKAAMWSTVLPRALREFRARRADVAVELKGARPGAQLAAIRRGELDVAFVHEAPRDAGLACVVLREEVLCLAVPAEHPLAARKHVVPADLEGMDWVALRSGRREPRRNENLLAACARRGFTPRVRFTVSDQETMLGLVAAGMGVAFLPESVSASRLVGVTLRQLPWLKLTRGLHAVTRSADLAATTTEFVACLKDVTKT
jgi:DNA-binding transcriptional LysR family regulator